MTSRKKWPSLHNDQEWTLLMSELNKVSVVKVYREPYFCQYEGIYVTAVNLNRAFQIPLLLSVLSDFYQILLSLYFLTTQNMKPYLLVFTTSMLLFYAQKLVTLIDVCYSAHETVSVHLKTLTKRVPSLSHSDLLETPGGWIWRYSKVSHVKICCWSLFLLC